MRFQYGVRANASGTEWVEANFNTRSMKFHSNLEFGLTMTLFLYFFSVKKLNVNGQFFIEVCVARTQKSSIRACFTGCG